MFADATTDEVPVKYQGEDRTVVIQKLTWKQLGNAKANRAIELAQRMKAMGGEVTKVMQEQAEEQTPEDDTPKAKAKAHDARVRAHVGAYDTETVLTHGIKSWDLPGVECNDRNKQRLDLETADLIKGRIIALSDPYKDPEEVKDSERKD